jgi:3-dehydroquinate synthase II
VKELWVKVEAAVAETEKLHLAASKIADVIVNDDKAVSRFDKHEIQIVNKLNEDAISKLKRNGKKVAVRINIRGKEDEDAAASAAESSVDYVLLNCLDWRVIPLENLIAKLHGKSKLIAEVSSIEEARLMLEALELGADGVLLRVSSVEELNRAASLLKESATEIKLTLARVLLVKQIGSGARVCVDTCDLMKPGEGLLVGCQSAGMFLVEAEVHENPYVQTRPFRVNAGALSMYTLTPAQHTRYLSELKAGDEVLIVDREGKTRQANVGRVKIEFRPLILVEAEAEGKRLKAILQNAETIHLLTPETSKPVTALSTGDQVLVHISTEGGRHFGLAVADEKVIER